MEAVIRIIDEYIESIEGTKNAEEICESVSAYVWDVEYLRCNFDVSKLYIHIAHTPTAQDFIREIEALWQSQKSKFKPFMIQLERLFYENRIVDMSDDGILISS